MTVRAFRRSCSSWQQISWRTATQRRHAMRCVRLVGLWAVATTGWRPQHGQMFDRIAEVEALILAADAKLDSARTVAQKVQNKWLRTGSLREVLAARIQAREPVSVAEIRAVGEPRIEVELLIALARSEHRADAGRVC